MAPKEFSGNQGNHQNFNVSILPYKFGLIFMVMKPKKYFWKKNTKWQIKKKLRFFKMANSQIFSQKFHRLDLGLVKIIDAKDIDVA